MGKLSGTDVQGFDAQLKTTKLFATPKEAADFTRSPDLPKTMRLVASFLYAHDLLGPGATSADVVGMTFPGGETVGDPANIKFRFTDTFMNMAADGKL